MSVSSSSNFLIKKSKQPAKLQKKIDITKYFDKKNAYFANIVTIYSATTRNTAISAKMYILFSNRLYTI